jgi:hypothetical protein
VAGRPESHGVIEKFNQDLCKLLGKKLRDRRGTLKPFEKKWSWALPAITAALNSTPSRATSIGFEGFSPSEIFHGLPAVAPLDRALRPREGLIPMNEAGVEEFMEAVRSSQARAATFVKQARVAYETQLDQERRNSQKTLRRFELGDLILRRVRGENGVERKTLPAYEEKPYVVVKGGHRGNYAVQLQRDIKAPCLWVHVDQIKLYISSQEERDGANDQAAIAEVLEGSEFPVEGIIGHRGRKCDGMREVLVKWQGSDEVTWEDEGELNNPELVKSYFRRGNPAQKVYEEMRAASATSPLEAERMPDGTILVLADLLTRDPRCLLDEICAAAGVAKADVMFVWASPPCETYSNAAYNVGRGEGHGYNYRDFNDPQRGPCCEDYGCKYRQKAILHDKCVPRLQQMIQADWDKGYNYNYMVENPHGCLGLRPFTETSQWPDQRVNKFTVDQCAFGKLTQKPTDLWTGLKTFRPVGYTGDGKCHSRCGRGYHNQHGRYRHLQAYAQEPNRQPKGADRVSIPDELTTEVLGAALDESRPQQRVLIDLYCGYRSLAGVATRMGLQYIGVDLIRRE